jgi:hypothetical protein
MAKKCSNKNCKETNPVFAKRPHRKYGFDSECNECKRIRTSKNVKRRKEDREFANLMFGNYFGYE